MGAEGMHLAAWLSVILAQATPLVESASALRARLLTAACGLVVFCFVLTVFVWLTGRLFRRHLRSERDADPWRRRPTRLPDDDWARKPLVPREEPRDETSRRVR